MGENKKKRGSRKRGDDKNHKLTIRVDEELYRKLMDICRVNGEKKTSYAREVLEEKLNAAHRDIFGEEPEMYEDYYEDAEETDEDEEYFC